MESPLQKIKSFLFARFHREGEDSSGQLTWDSALLFVGNGVISVLFLLFHVVTGRTLSGAAYAELVAMIGLLNVLNVPAGVMQLTISRYVADWGQNAEDKTWLQIVHSGLRNVTKWGLVALVVWFVMSRFLYIQMGADSVTSLWLTGFAAFVFLYTPILGGALQGRHYFGWFVVSGLGVGLSRLVLAGGLLPFSRTASSMLLAVSLSFVVGLLLSWIPLRKERPDADAEPLKMNDHGIQKYFLGVLLGQGALYILINADLILMPRLLEGTTLEAYSKAATVARIVFFLPLPIMIAMFPRAVVSQKPSILFIPLAGTLGVSLLAAGFMSLFPSLLFTVIYGEVTPEQIDLVRLYVWATIPFALISILSPYLWARKQIALTMGLIPVTGFYLVGLLSSPQSPQSIIMLMAMAGGLSFLFLLIFTVRILR